MINCDICAIRLHTSEGVFKAILELFGFKEAEVITVVDQENMCSYISLVCKKDKAWVLKNPLAAEAIYRVRMRDER